MSTDLCEFLKDERSIIEFEKLRFELAWRHFDFHARQRTTMFHFFILLVPVLFGGCFILFREREIVGPWLGITASFTGAVLALIFFLLDLRNRQMYRVSRGAISLIEKQFLFTEYRPLFHGDRYPGVMTKEAALYGDKRILRHSTLMGTVYCLAIILFGVLGGYFYAVQKEIIELPSPSNVTFKKAH